MNRHNRGASALSTCGATNRVLKGFFLLALVLVALCLLSCNPEQAPEKTRKAATQGKHAGKAAGIEILFVYGSEKEQWINDVTASFNRAVHKTGSGKSIHVKAVPMGSGETVDGVLSGTLKAHLISPASEAFIKMGNAKSLQKTGKKLVESTQNLVLSPVVIAMWKPMAEALGWGKKPVGWADILAMASNEQGWAAYGKPQWGRFKIGHTHPQFSNSGLISLFAEVYAGAGKKASLTIEDVRSPKVGEYLEAIEKSVVHYGSSTGFFGRKLFAEGPAYLSAAVLYENMVIESYDPKYSLPFPIVAIYPVEGTFWSDHPAGIVESEWITPEQRDAGEIYLKYLLARPQQEKALLYGFRPSLVEIPLKAPFDPEHGIDRQEPKTTLEVPSVPVIDAIIALWKRHKKHADVVLLLDTSGSMQEKNKIQQAKAGAKELIKMLDEEDRLSLIAFNNRVAWADKDVRIKDGRERINRQIDSLFADGGTAFYDAVGQAYQYLARKQTSDRIFAVVALTDGLDRDSSLSLQNLISEIQYERDVKNVRVFTIGYGSDADHSVLKRIAEATKVKSYKGTPQNIRKVFETISTFF
jgi:Ca-activated chloride channel family protein